MSKNEGSLNTQCGVRGSMDLKHLGTTTIGDLFRSFQHEKLLSKSNVHSVMQVFLNKR
jgi:hypothetical protein